MDDRLDVFYPEDRGDPDCDLPSWHSTLEGVVQMIALALLSIAAVIAGYTNIWLAMLNPTLEARVTSLLMVIVVDILMLIGYKIWVGDPFIGLFLSVKYLFFCFVHFDKTLRRGI